MTKKQEDIFSELSGRLWNKTDTQGCWSKNCNASLTAWHFTFLFSNNILYTCLSNRMCGELYAAYDPYGAELSKADSIFDDLIISEYISVKKMIESKHETKLIDLIKDPIQRSFKCVFTNDKPSIEYSYSEISNMFESN